MTRWKLVPEEPTPRMIFAGRKQLARGEAVHVYNAMLAVSPIYLSADGLVERLLVESKLCREAADALCAMVEAETERAIDVVQSQRKVGHPNGDSYYEGFDDACAAIIDALYASIWSGSPPPPTLERDDRRNDGDKL